MQMLGTEPMAVLARLFSPPIGVIPVSPLLLPTAPTPNRMKPSDEIYQIFPCLALISALDSPTHSSSVCGSVTEHQPATPVELPFFPILCRGSQTDQDSSGTVHYPDSSVYFLCMTRRGWHNIATSPV